MLRKFKCYVCDEEDCNSSADTSNSAVCENAIVCWKSLVREPDGTTRGNRGCIQRQDQVLLYCNRHRSSGNHTSSISRPGGGSFHTECCHEELCNGGLFPTLEGDTSWFQMKDPLTITLVVLVPILILGFIIGIIVWYYRHRRNVQSRLTSQNNAIMESGLGDSTLKEYLHFLMSGSGSGFPFPRLVLHKRPTLAQQVLLVKRLTEEDQVSKEGCFGYEVWRGIRFEENVAVKIYNSIHENLWAHETEVYKNIQPSGHVNILGYIGSDTISRFGDTEHWLVTNYHPMGSLYNYLIKLSKPLNHNEIFNICLSIANGLLYLHTPIDAAQGNLYTIYKGKPAMAHRNLKSKSIFVKNDGTCAIADLTHVVTQEKLSSDMFDLTQHSKRYLSPELLEQKYDPQRLEDFQCADIYSLGLIFWEVCRTCISDGVTLDYVAPYSEWFESGNQEPSLEEMRKLVVEDERRPSIPNPWESDQTLTGIGKIIKECWYTNATARLPIFRIKKTLIKLASGDPKVSLPLDQEVD